MTTGAGISRLSGTAKRINRQLALYVKATAAAGDTRNNDGMDPVQLVKLNNPRAAREDGRAFDGLHLNARGYRAFAEALYDALGPMMVAVEWKFWKAHLASRAAGGGGATVAPISGASVKPKSKESKKAD